MVNSFLGLVHTVRRLFADRRGSAAAFVAIGAVAMTGALGLATDAARGYLIKARLSQALDAAALAGGRAINSPNRDADILMYFNANFPPGYLGATVSGPNIQIDPSGKVLTLTASATVPTTLMRVLGQTTMNVAGATEVTIESRNLEVALVLDVTGSMAGQRIADLKSAAHELIDIVVHDQQTPYYSKLALVPYSMGVNVAGNADQIRGPVTGPAVNIVDATRTNPVVITTATPHGFSNGETVYITGVGGMTQLNNKQYTVANATATTFALSGVNGTNYGSFGSGGIVGRVCTTPGCEFFRFTNASGSTRTFRSSTCVSERTGANAYTDVAPSTEFVGRNYPSTNNPCLDNAIVPLTSDKSELHNQIDALVAEGSTAGHIGIAWGWYMLSPNFGYLWPAASQPAAYGAEKLLKVAIIMTDGELNTAYCNGVIAKDSGSGSGSNSDKINCDATNGSSFSQAHQLCANMKAAGIIIYTVGFDISSSTNVVNLLQQCATSPSYVYLPENGGALQDAFRAIAMSVSRLRLSK